MQTIRINLTGDDEIDIHAEREVSDEQALGLYRKLRKELFAEGGKKRGRKPKAESEEEAAAESITEQEE